MKIEEWGMRVESFQESAREYLGEAAICLETPIKKQGVLFNPVLGHAAFATVCAAFRLLERQSDMLTKIKPKRFLFWNEEEKLEPEGDWDVAKEVVDRFLESGTHMFSASLYRNKASAARALEEGVVMGIGYPIVALEEMIEELVGVLDRKEWG